MLLYFDLVERVNVQILLSLGTVPPAAASFEFEKGTGKEEGNFSCTVSYLNR